MSKEDTPIASETVSRKLPREAEHLAALEQMKALEAYYQWSLDLFKTWLGRRILDAGCGVGNFTALLEPLVEEIIAVDLSPMNIEMLKKRFSTSSKVEILQVDLDQQTQSLADREVDTISCLDVLEHVDDDRQLMRSMYRILQPGGHLLVKVPAVPWLYGSVDEASDHRRRYSKRELAEKLRDSGFALVRLQYMNVAGVLPYWLKSRVLKKRTNFSRTFKPWQLRVIQRVIPILQLTDRLLGPPIGQSLIAVGGKPGTAEQ